MQLKETDSNLSILLSKYLMPFSKKEPFEIYLKIIFPSISCMEKQSKKMYIPFVIFHKLTHFPLIVSKQLYRIFIKEESYLYQDEFVNGMLQLYQGSLNKRLSLIFSMCDFNSDGKIIEEDVILILKYFHHLRNSSNANDPLSFNHIISIISQLFNKRSSLTLDELKNEVRQTSEFLMIFIIYFQNYNPFSLENIDWIESKEIINEKEKNCVENKEETDCFNEMLGECSKELFLYINNQFNEELIYYENDCNTSIDELDKFEEEIRGVITDASSLESDSPIAGFNKRKASCLSGQYNEMPRPIIPIRHMSSILKAPPMNTCSSSNEVTKSTKTIPNFTKSFSYFKSQFASNNNQKQGITLEGKMILKGKLEQVTLSLINKDIFISYNNNLTQIINMTNYLISIQTNEDLNGKLINSILFSPYYAGYLTEKKIICSNHDLMIEFGRKVQDRIKQRHIKDYYEFIAEIWKGDYSIIFKAKKYDKPNNIYVVKIISKQNIDMVIPEMIETEVEVFRLLQMNPHDHIVFSYDLFETVNFYYIINEYLPHGTLSDHLHNYQCNQFNDFKTFSAQIINAVDYLHSFGIVHRDLKTDNVLVSKQSNQIILKLNDFGLSKIMGFTEKAEESCGSLCYTAPEILNRNPYNHQVDIWSLGVLLYYLWYKQYPFYDIYNNLPIVASKIIAGRYTVPRKPNGSSQDDQYIQKFIAQCLTVNVNERVNIKQLFFCKT